MKTLYLVRHAKSSWDNPELADFDRPLNDRGKRDAPRMGKKLREREIHPNLIISSPAKRAMSTGKRIAEALGFPQKNIKTDQGLYHANAEELLSIVQKLPDTCERIVLIGHNPGLTDFANDLTRDQAVITNVPTCGVVAYEFDVNSWQQVDFGKGRFLFFDYPKKPD